MEFRMQSQFRATLQVVVFKRIFEMQFSGKLQKKSQEYVDCVLGPSLFTVYSPEATLTRPESQKKVLRLRHLRKDAQR